jgi:hypothetical protein
MLRDARVTGSGKLRCGIVIISTGRFGPGTSNRGSTSQRAERRLWR